MDTSLWFSRVYCGLETSLPFCWSLNFRLFALYIKQFDLLDLSQLLTMDRYIKIASLGRILISFKILFKGFLKVWCILTLQNVNDVFGGIPFSIWYILVYMLYIVLRIRALEVCKNKSFESVSSTFISYCKKNKMQVSIKSIKEYKETYKLLMLPIVWDWMAYITSHSSNVF